MLNHLKKIAELLTNKCPKCSSAFIFDDLTTCCALTCGVCGIGFCAFCHQGASENAHRHVANCVENLDWNTGVFCEEEEYLKQQRDFKRRLIQDYLQPLEPVVKESILHNPLFMEYF